MSSPDIWLSGLLVVTSSISSIVLSIQRGVSHTNRNDHEDKKNVDFVDTIRDPTDPFVDNNRLTRLTFSTLILTTLAALDLVHELQRDHHHHKHNNVIAIVSNACVFIFWLYALALTLLSRRYRLPNAWGWKLNVHLFILFSVAFILAIYRFFQHVIVSHPNMSWIRALPYILSCLFTMDLVYVTATVKQGSNYLDSFGRPVCGTDVASIWGKWFFSWATPIYTRISKKKGDFSDEDLPVLPPSYRASTIFNTFCIGTTSDNHGSLLRRLLSANRNNFIKQVGLSIFASGLYYVPAYMMNRVLQFLQDVSDGKVTEHIALKSSLLVLGMGVSIVVLGLIVGQLWYYASVALQTQIRTMLSVEIYRKSLRRRDLSTASSTDEEQQPEGDSNTKTKEQDSSDDSSSTGAIVNLMSTDASRISEFGSLWFTVIAAPLELIIGFFFLYQLIGISCFLGLLVMVIVLPVNHFNAKIFAKTQDRLMEVRDKRVSLMNEVLQGIRQIKFFAWESKWEERIMAARKVELDHLGITYINGVFFSLVWQGAPILVTLVSFYSFTKIQGNQLTAPIAFTVISIFAELRYALNVLPEMFIQGIQAYASLKRIEKFLNEEEIEQPEQDQDQLDGVSIGFKNATLGWSKNDTNSFILKDINATFPRHELSLISGVTGSGKTLMLLGLLGEACVLQGKASCPRVPVADGLVSDLDIINGSDKIDPDDWILERSLAYVSQTPWLQNVSIRNNILFGLPFVASRYNETLAACALIKDLSILEDGDLTEIGEKGITLSGGQKARVALARAVYSRAGNIIMDDCLSAVDAHTAKHLYTQCLMGPLMKNRTRILVTHHVKLCLRSCAYLIHIKDGRAEFVGSPTELIQTGHLDEVLAEGDNEEEEEEEEQKEQEEVDEIEIVANEVSSSSTSDLADQDKVVKEKKPRALVEEETRATGRIKFSLYKVYFGLVGNGFFWLVMALIVFTARGLEIGESWWIKKWAESYNTDVNSTMTSTAMTNGINTNVITAYVQPKFFVLKSYQEPEDIEIFTQQQQQQQQQQQYIFGSSSSTTTFTNGDDNLNYYLGIYALIAISNVLVSALRYGFIFWGSLRANKQLYENLLKRVLRAPLRFFDTTPLGRILNRFSKDFESIDSRIPGDFMAFIVQWFIILTSIFTISFVIPALILPVIFVAVLNVFIGLRYINSSRELKRLESVSRSPVFSCFTETVSGVSTIRAFGASQQFLQVMMDCIDANMRPFMLTWLCNRWVSVRYSLTSACVNLCAFAVVLANMDHINVPLAGFGLSFVLMFSDNIFWGVRQYTGIEMAFNSVERVVEFTEIDQEPPAITDVRPPPQWPSKGEIQVKDLEVRYAADLEPVIRGISFDVKAQEKVGIVGRTGSGKSTLALSFFRFVEATAGSITIDSININDLGTEDLRSNLTIIPQDPTLFSGTLRSNMDPFDEFNDSDIYLAFRRVHLIPSNDGEITDDSNSEEVNANVFKNLESQVSEGGKNFSQGQRQLICLARALLKRSRVVLMDEATASVDFETDKAIQETISTEFSDSTILCIAHRLHTVIEYDRILVLDHGRVVEYENPLTLLRNTKSTFYQMCQKSGEFDSLLELAKQKHSLVDTD